MHRYARIFLIFIGYLQGSSCVHSQANIEPIKESMIPNVKTDTITLGAGCFWCVEAVFQQLKGVYTVESGYSGGNVKNPSYKEVCTGTTGHAEVCQIAYNPAEISFREILEVYWQTHDPTTLNRQGADAGTQYRSVIFYHNEQQKLVAEEMKKKLDDARIYKNPVVTQIVPFENFYIAENYHQEYYFNNTAQPYCSMVITPKIEKFKKIFSEKLKEK